MSTRVQKGGQKFKPVTKARGRLGSTPSRHTSAAPDTNILLARDSTSSAHPLSKPTNSTDLPTVSEEAEDTNSAFVSQQNGESSFSANDSRNSTYSGVIGGAGVFVTSTISEQNSAWTAPAQDRLQDRQNTPQLLGSSRAAPVVISSRTADNSTQRPAIPIVLQTRSSTPILPKATVSTDATFIEGNSQLTLVNVHGTERTISSTAVVVPDSTAPITEDPAISGNSVKAKKHRRKSTPSRANSRTPAENDKGKRRRTSAVKAAAVIDSQSQVGSSHPEQSSGKRPRKKRAEVSEYSEVHSETEQENDYIDESDHSSRPRKRRRSTTVSSSREGRRKRIPSLPPFDPDADPGEELDPTVVTMATICADTGHGRVSSKAAIILSNHAAWKAESKAKRARMKALMEAKKYGRNEEDLDAVAVEAPEPIEVQAPTAEPQADGEEIILEGDGQQEVEAGGFNYSESMATNRFSAQVRIGPNGETIIDEESLFVDRAEGDEDATEQYTHVEESDQTKFVNSASYSRKSRGSRWSAEETELFYDALSQFGENYELISYILPGRDRKACKNKFKAEDKKNPFRITFALKNRVPVDMDTLSRMTGKDFSGPTPEIKAPEIPTFEPVPDMVIEESAPDRPVKQIRKKSRTPAGTDGVEILGDVETFALDVDE